MEFADVLRHRKMVRTYTEDPVPKESVERIVAVGRRTPAPEPMQAERKEGLSRRRRPLEEVVRRERW